MPYAIPHWVWVGIVVSVCALAAWRGGRDERTAALGLLVGSLLSKVLYAHHGEQTEWGVLAVDTALLGVLTWVALSSSRYWPLFAASFQLLAVVIHVARIADRSLSGCAIAIGTWNARRDRAQLAASADPRVAPGATRR
jgi:hypothetical protein